MRGSIKQRNKGSWSIRVDMGYETVTDPKTGETRRRRRQKRITVRGTKRQAEQKLSDLLSALQRNEYVEPSKTTFGEWLDEWFEMMAGRPDKWRDGTKDRYGTDIRKHIKPALGDVRLQELSPSDLQNYYNASSLKGKTLQRHHTIISGALKAAHSFGYVTRNVAPLVPSKPKAEDSHGDVISNCWSAEEARKFLSAAADDSLQAHAFYTLALETGMRKGELCGLKWDDLDVAASTITVARTLLKPGRKPKFGPPKNGKPRTIRLAPETMRLLKRHRLQQNERKMKNRPHYRDHGLIFAKDWEDMTRQTDCLGDPLQLNNLGQRQYARLIEAAGVRPIKFHGMRHTFATLALMNGTPPHVVQQILGHKRIEITLGIYSHVLPDQQEEVAAKMSAMLRK